MTTDLSGKRAVVVGAEFPAGGAIARTLAEAGADIALCALTADEAVMRSRRVRRDVEALGRRAAEYVMDVTLGRNVQVTTRQVAKEMGGLDIVVSAPDLAFDATISRTSDSELARILQVNFSAQFFVVRTASEEFRRQGAGGRILLVTSALGAQATGGSVAYGAAHAAVHHLARAAAEELRPDGIALNAIALPVQAESMEEIGAAALRLVGEEFVTGTVVDLADA